MPVFLSEAQIGELVGEKKRLPDDYERKLRTRAERGHDEADVTIEGSGGAQFRVIVRKGRSSTLDFSVILGFLPQKSNTLFRLCRYNGKHQHSNRLEGEEFYDFHIHQATERYQHSGYREDTYAEPTDRYSTVEQALQCMFDDCGFDAPGAGQTSFMDRLGA